MTSHEKYVEACCEVMHYAYEKAAIGAGWETQIASRKMWEDVPEANKITMRAAVQELLVFINATEENGDTSTVTKTVEYDEHSRVVKETIVTSRSN